jgi:hypothetical protein
MGKEHDDWLRQALGLDPQSYVTDPGAADGGEDQRDAPDDQAAGQAQIRAADQSPSNDPNADAPDVLLDPKAGKGSPGGGFTKTPEQVEKEVTDKFGTYIPKGQLDKPASKVTNFQDDTTFQNELTKRHPDLAKYGIDPKSVMGESYDGKIYINKDKADIGTAYHEQMHHYSSSEFIKQLGVVGGVKFNEGVTEYLTRETYSGDRPGHYDTEEKLAEAIAKKVGEDILRKAYFQGDADAMKKVSDALAGK